jgi:DNA polymerase-3 subunit epsilon
VSERLVVLDLETTGFGTADRVVEIALVELDANLAPVATWTSLVDPCRDIGNAEYHGITSSMCSTAPTFADLAGAIAELIEGAVLVGHNIRSFDMRMLAQEFGRLDAEIDGRPIDTMHMASRAGLERSLTGACREVGISEWNHHSALEDTLACAELLRCLSGHVDPDDPFPTSVQSSTSLSVSPRTARRPAETIPLHVAALRRVALPAHPELSPSELGFLALLDECMADFSISPAEAAELHFVAGELSLSETATQRLEQLWFDDLYRNAMADGVITAAEAERLNLAAEALRIGRPFTPTEVPTGEITSLAGHLVTFTGTLGFDSQGREWDKASAEALAERSGARAHPRFTKQVTLVVAADPDSNSGKAARARSAGVPIMSFATFLELAEAP